MAISSVAIASDMAMNPEPQSTSGDTTPPQTKRHVVHYSGRVQGVGFRYCARQTAEGFAVSGFVLNLSDGRVRLVAEGQSTELNAFLAELSARMGRNIRHAQQQIEAPTGEFSTFEIRF